ncbi:MAG: transcription antitermination factor NusB [Clostridia bacterium]|nr:transcription antitermination factor NusB [Clostridia bacterium]
MTRSEQRQLILGLVFEKTFHEEPVPEVIQLAVETREIVADDFITRCVNGVFENLDQIDKTIEENCIGWKLSRIPRVSLCIMRVAVYEILFEQDIPVGASINEAVELAKKYAGDEDPSYINGVLGAVARKLEK